MIPTNLKSRAINVVNWDFDTEAEILALGQDKRFLNVVYTSGTVRYKAIEETVNGTLVKTLVKDTDGALTNVTASNGAKATKTGQTVAVELDLSGDTNQAAQIESGKLIVKKMTVDADSANLAEFVDVQGGGQKLVIKRAGRRGKYVRTAAADLATFVASLDYTAGTTTIAGDTLIFVNSEDENDAGYNQVRFSYECVDIAGGVNDFIEHEKTDDATDVARQSISSDSTVVTYNPVTGKLNHNFSTAARSALKVNGAGAAEVIVGAAIVTSSDESDITVQAYFDALSQKDADHDNELQNIATDLQSVTQRVSNIEAITYTQGMTKTGSAVKVGGDVSETRTTTLQTGGRMKYEASASGVGTLLDIQADRIVFGKNSINVIGQPRYWLDPATSLFYGVDFDIHTGAEFLSIVASPNL